MDIISYLEEILLKSKEVGITGLGMLYKKKFPGKYDKEKQAFLPPSYSLAFTTEITETEKLVNLIAEKENISHDSAKNAVAEFVEETNKKLELAHEAILPNIGRLFYTEHEGLSFEPAKERTIGSEFFGLPILPETHHEEIATKPDAQIAVKNDEEETFDEIDEAPKNDVQIKQPIVEPIIENIELDEVKDDLKNTLKHIEHASPEVTDAPDFIKEQHEEHPDRFGHQPEKEQETTKTYINLEENKQEELPISEAPDFIIEQHEEHPNRFGHQPESEQDAQPQNSNLQDQPEIIPVSEAPDFIKEQHEEHPNRFGNDPMVNPDVEETKPVWPKILMIIVGLLIIAALVYFLKPELFNTSVRENPNTALVTDSIAVKPDNAKIKQDSIAKADSILKVNLVQNSIDTTNNKSNNVIATTEKITFEVIGVSFEKLEKANRYIKAVKKIGIDARIVKMPGKRQNISVGSFKTQKEAEENLVNLQKKLDGKGFYVQQIINTQP